MSELVVGIPTLCRYDLLQDCLRSILESSIRPQEICVVDNGGHFEHELGSLANGCPIRIERPGWNLGVAGSWNHIHSLYAPRNVIYMNDDMVIAPDVLERLAQSPGPFATPIPDPRNWWSCFLQREPVWEAIGEYDDGFWPAYFEDGDYKRRMRLAGLEPRVVDGHGGFAHRGSATGGLAFAWFEWNRRRYVRKWGGEPGGEEFPLAWDGRPHSERDMYYEHVCSEESDIRDHCPTLAILASACEHVTVLGSRAGVSTIPLLYAQPQDIECYDTDPHPEFDNLFRISGRTRLAFHRADTRTMTIAETDLLVVDTFHVYEQSSEELRRHADRVRRYIALHDTTTFGEQGEVPGSRGIWPAVIDFLTDHPEWRLLARYHHNNGLSVLERVGFRAEHRTS